jgi:hypothetical protein
MNAAMHRILTVAPVAFFGRARACGHFVGKCGHWGHGSMKIASCLQTKRNSGPCLTCGATPNIVHLYGDQPAVCSRCCPVCALTREQQFEGNGTKGDSTCTAAA